MYQPPSIGVNPVLTRVVDKESTILQKGNNAIL